METIVLIKQVPATESFIRIDDDGKSIKKDDLKWVMNPYDEFAVEEALRIRESKGGSVTLITVGTEKAIEALRTGLAMGADKAMLIDDPAALSRDGLGIAGILAAAVKTLSFDLIIAGQRAVDDDSGMVGTAVAEFLDIPNISLVVKQDITESRIRCHWTVEGGTVVQETSFPALITTQRGLNEPRYASLPGIMKAKKKPIDKKSLSDLGLNADEFSPPGVEIVSLQIPPERKGGKIVRGATAAEKASELVRLLREEAKVI